MNLNPYLFCCFWSWWTLNNVLHCFLGSSSPLFSFYCLLSYCNKKMKLLLVKTYYKLFYLSEAFAEKKECQEKRTLLDYIKKKQTLLPSRKYTASMTCKYCKKGEKCASDLKDDLVIISSRGKHRRTPLCLSNFGVNKAIMEVSCKSFM